MIKIIVHDYGGHPFPFALSKELSKKYLIYHLYFGNDYGPKQSVGNPYRFADPNSAVSGGKWVLGAYPDYPNISGISGLTKSGWNGTDTLYPEKDTLVPVALPEPM